MTVGSGFYRRTGIGGCAAATRVRTSYRSRRSQRLLGCRSGPVGIPDRQPGISQRGHVQGAHAVNAPDLTHLERVQRAITGVAGQLPLR